MKRTGFKRKAPARRPCKTYEVYTVRPRTVAVARADAPGRMCVPVPKNHVTRDDDYRRLVASLPCINCGAVGHSQCAHANSPAAGKAGARKADDRESFPLCTVGANDCHGAFDQRAMFTKEQRREIEPLWSNQTRMKLRAMAANDPKVARIVARVIGL